MVRYYFASKRNLEAGGFIPDKIYPSIDALLKGKDVTHGDVFGIYEVRFMAKYEADVEFTRINSE